MSYYRSRARIGVDRASLLEADLITGWWVARPKPCSEIGLATHENLHVNVNLAVTIHRSLDRIRRPLRWHHPSTVQRLKVKLT